VLKKLLRLEYILNNIFSKENLPLILTLNPHLEERQIKNELNHLLLGPTPLKKAILNRFYKSNLRKLLQKQKIKMNNVYCRD